MADIHTKKEADTTAALNTIFDQTASTINESITEVEVLKRDLEQVKVELNEVKTVVNKLVQKALEPSA